VSWQRPGRIFRSCLCNLAAVFHLDDRAADLKSADQSAVQILYKRSPECSKTPQNALLSPLSHNNIRKTGSIRNRQVTSSTLVVGSIFSRVYRSVHRDLLHNCCTSYFCFQLLHGVGHDLGYRLDVASLRRAHIFVAQNCLDHLVRHSEFMKVSG
jgi:hypothetical protein